jgi:hypothetical protein
MAKNIRPGKKDGRPKIEFTDADWKKIEQLCSIQCTAEEIASVMGCSVDTLSRRIESTYGITFADYIKKHSLGGKASLRRVQFNLAKKNATMALWLGKQYLGQRDDCNVQRDTTQPHIILNFKGSEDE